MTDNKRLTMTNTTNEPVFAMSMYASSKDLFEAKAKYYKDRCESLTATNRELESRIAELEGEIALKNIGLKTIQDKSRELCLAVENDADLPPVKYALKCGYLINRVKDLLPTQPIEE